MSETKFHGWSRGFTNLYIGHIPSRKRIAMYTEHCGSVYVLGWFVSEEAAREALAAIDVFTGGPRLWSTYAYPNGEEEP
jgi:hypothetical protein